MQPIFGYSAFSEQSLVKLRRGLGLLAFVDSVERFWLAEFFYADLGILPRSLYYELFEQQSWWSFYCLSGHASWTYCLLILTSMIALAHFWGRSTLTSRVILLILVVSVQNRNPSVLDPADHLLRLLLFWELFFPQKLAEQEKASVAWATLSLQLQLTIFQLVALKQLLWPDADSLSVSPNFFVPAFPGPALAGVAFSLVLLLATWVRKWRFGCTVAAALLAIFLGQFYPWSYLLTLVLVYASLTERTVTGLELPEGKVSRLGVSFLLASWLLIIGLYLAPARMRAKLLLLTDPLACSQSFVSLSPQPRHEPARLMLRQVGTQGSLEELPDWQGRRGRLYACSLAKNRLWLGKLLSTELLGNVLGREYEVWLEIGAQGSPELKAELLGTLSPKPTSSPEPKL